MVRSPKPTYGTGVLFEDHPPIKEEVWTSLHQPMSAEHYALVEQLIGVLCAIFLTAVERQLFDFINGKWREESHDLRYESATVPRNNDISEWDFSDLDRLVRIKSTARLDFICELVLYTNKTAAALRKMSRQLHEELGAAITLVRETLKKLCDVLTCILCKLLQLLWLFFPHIFMFFCIFSIFSLSELWVLHKWLTGSRDKKGRRSR